MQFRNRQQEQAYKQVSVWVRELFGEMAQPKENAPVFTMIFGSAAVHIQVLPWNDTAIINFRSNVVMGPEKDEELLHWLLRENWDMRFGTFGLDKDGDVFFDYTVPFTGCSKQSLKDYVMAVVITADRYDDKIVARWGGRKYIDD